MDSLSIEMRFGPGSPKPAHHRAWPGNVGGTMSDPTSTGDRLSLDAVPLPGERYAIESP